MKKLTRILCLMVAAILLSCVAWTSVAAAEVSPAKKGLDAMTQQFEKKTTGYVADMWTALSLRTSGEMNNADYMDLIPAVDLSKVPADDLLSLTPAVMSLVLSGIDPTDVSGRHPAAELLALLTEENGFTGTTNPGDDAAAAWALYMANKKYGTAFSDADKSKIINYLNRERKTDGDYAGGYVMPVFLSNVDVSAQVLIGQVLLGDSNSADRTASYLLSTLDGDCKLFLSDWYYSDDAFGSGTDASPNAQALALAALAMWKLSKDAEADLAADADLKGPYEGLLTFQLEGGEFAYMGAASFFADKQCIWAANFFDAAVRGNVMTLFNETRYLVLAKAAPPVEEEKTVSTDPSSTPAESVVPPTGEQIAVWIIVILIVAVVVLAAVILVPALMKRKK